MLSKLFKKKKIPQALPENYIRKEYHFEGTVQNIGFRFEIQRRAKPLGLTGWAENNDDGSVTCQLQGEEYKIDHVIHSLNQIDRVHFDFIGEKEIPLDSKESDFIIIY